MQTLFFHHQDYLAADEAAHFARVTLDGSPPRALHGQDFYEVFWIESGSARHWINGTVETLGPGDLVFMRPGDVHGFQGPCALTNLLVLPQTVNHLGARYAEMRTRGFWSGGALPERVHLDRAQRRALDRAARDLEDAPRSLLSVEAFVLNLFTRVLLAGPSVPPDTPDWLASALRACEAPEVFRDGAAGLVAAARRSHPHVSRAMQKHLGTTPTAHINAVRMRYAARQLAGSDASLTQIALDCGFENLSHFHKLFRAHHGASPHQWRKRRQVQVVQPVLP